MFGASMHSHGMYQMAFLEAIQDEIAAPIVNGYIGEVLSGDGLAKILAVHEKGIQPTIDNEHFIHWPTQELLNVFNTPLENIYQDICQEISREVDAISAAWHQKITILQLWSRQRFFTNFSSTLKDYWRGVQSPYLNRAYAQFCLSLPRAVMDDRKLLGDVYRRHFGKLAVIPGTYANVPLITTGRYHMNRRLARLLPTWLHFGEIKTFSHVPLHMDADCVMAHGWESLWPIHEVWEGLGKWMDVEKIKVEYQAASTSNRDIKPVRKLQSVQALAYLLLR
jgi:hypothetical protein